MQILLTFTQINTLKLEHQKNSELRTQNYLFDNQKLTKPYKTVQLYYIKKLCQETNTKEYRFRSHDGHLLESNILILMLHKTVL